MKTKKEYIDEYLAEAQPGHEEIVKKKKETDTALKNQANAALDASADAAAGVYRQQIEQAPLDSRIQYDKNAMQEAVDRKKIAESLANMGMTDSGLSGSMNTALTIQKSRADNSVRAAERQRIRAAESAIDQIYANAEAEKAKQGIAIDQATANWETQAYADMHNAALTAGATAYAADAEAENAAIDRAETLKGNRISIAQNHIGRGVDSFEAWGQAYRSYPDAGTAEGQLYAYYNQLRDQGYDIPYAKAMATAYMNTIAAGGSEAEAKQAMTRAYTQVKTEEENAALLKKQQEDALIEQANAAALLKQQQDTATAKTKRDNEIYDARVKLAQGYISDGMDVDEAWAMAYRAYPDTSTAEGYQYAVYNQVYDQLKAGGYSGKAAAAMSSAYLNVIANKGTEEQAVAAMQTALVPALEAEVRKAGINLYSGNRRGETVSLSLDRISNTAQVYTAAGLSAEATAYAIGKGYLSAVTNGDDNVANQVGQALAGYFSGIYLEIALSAAGLE